MPLRGKFWSCLVVFKNEFWPVHSIEACSRRADVLSVMLSTSTMSASSIFVFPFHQLNAANEPVLPLSSIRRAAHVYVHGTFDVAPTDAEDSEDVADETLSLESRLKSRGASGEMYTSRAGSSASVTEVRQKA